MVSTFRYMTSPGQRNSQKVRGLPYPVVHEAQSWRSEPGQRPSRRILSPRPQVPRCDKQATSSPRRKHPPDYGRRYWGGCDISEAPVVAIWNVRLSRE